MNEPEFRHAALRAQELLAVTRAIEARVSALTTGTPASVVEETAALVRAAAMQVAAIVHELIAASVRMTPNGTAVPGGRPLDYASRP